MHGQRGPWENKGRERKAGFSEEIVRDRNDIAARVCRSLVEKRSAVHEASRFLTFDRLTTRKRENSLNVDRDVKEGKKP